MRRLVRAAEPLQPLSNSLSDRRRIRPTRDLGGPASLSTLALPAVAQHTLEEAFSCDIHDMLHADESLSSERPIMVRQDALEGSDQSPGILVGKRIILVQLVRIEEKLVIVVSEELVSAFFQPGDLVLYGPESGLADRCPAA
jgi:hypothetical protein